MSASKRKQASAFQWLSSKRGTGIKPTSKMRHFTDLLDPDTDPDTWANLPV